MKKNEKEAPELSRGRHMEKKPRGEAKPRQEAKSREEAKPRRKRKARAEEKPAKKSGGKKTGWIVAAVVFLVLLLGLGAGAMVLGGKIAKSDKILPNVCVADVQLGGLTQAEAEQTLTQGGWNERVSGTLAVSLPMDTGFTVDYIQAGASLTADKAAEAAFRYGHEGNDLEVVKAYLHSLSKATDVSDTPTVLDDAYIRAQMQKGVDAFKEVTAEREYVLDEEKGRIVFLKGAGQMKIDEEALYTQVAEALSQRQTAMSYALPESDYSMPDFAALHTQLAAEVADARYDPETDSVIPDIKGVDFDVEEAQRLWNAAAPGDEVAVPVTLTAPAVTAEALQELLFRDLLGAQTTNYWGSTKGRINNIDLVAQKLNGLVLMPGDIFSYNGYVGQRTEEAGFQYAAAYDNGKVVQEIGGGICQVSSTLYCASVAANLETLDRTCHYFAVGYLQKGLDATVSWPKPDFSFRNNRDYPVRIAARSNHDDKSLTIEIWGTNVDGSYVEFRGGAWPTYDSTYPDVQVGWGALSWRYIYDKDGNLLNKVEEARSEYFLHEEDIKWPEVTQESEAPIPVETPVTSTESTPAPATPTPAAPEPTPPDEDVTIGG